MARIENLLLPEDIGRLERLVALSLEEDLGRRGDLTTDLLVPADAVARAAIYARTPGVVAGVPCLPVVFERAGGEVRITPLADEGSEVETGAPLARVDGRARTILTGERVALNLLGRACGVATATRAFVRAVEGTVAKIFDTRKTLPGFRAIDKYAVRVAGGRNHRSRLDEMTLVKDNHLAFLGGDLAEAVARAREAGVPVEVEVDAREALDEALDARPDLILLDNFTPGSEHALDDVAFLDDGGLRRLLGEIDADTLAHVVRGAPEGVLERIFANLSEREAAGLRKRLRRPRSTRSLDIEAARARVAGWMRRLERAGEIRFTARLAEAVAHVRARCGAGGLPLIEASGGITLANARAVAETGVDRISVGALTHSVRALDLSLEFEE